MEPGYRERRLGERECVLPCCLPGTGRRKESYNVGVPTRYEADSSNASRAIILEYIVLYLTTTPYAFVACKGRSSPLPDMKFSQQSG